MAAVLAVTPEERPVLAFVLARLIPEMRRGTAEQLEVAERLAYTSAGLDAAPAGPGEVELLAEDLYHVGLRMFSLSVDVEEYWRDRLALARGGAAAESANPEVAAPLGRYLPEIDENPVAWNFRTVQPHFLELGFKIDRLINAEAPRVRAIYNKEREVIVSAAVERREKNAEKRIEASAATVETPRALLSDGRQSDDHAEEAPRRRPTGSAAAADKTAPAGLSRISRATLHGPYQWGVEAGTGVSADDLEPDAPRRVNVGGEALMLVNADGKVCAAARTCQHRQWDLTRGGTVENGVITCKLHGAQYNVCTGEVVRDPFDRAFNKEHSLMGGMMSGLDPKHSTGPLQTYPTIVGDDGEVRVHI